MATSRKLVPQKIGPVDKRRRPRGLTRAVRTALDAIIFDRCTRLEACERAGITERAIYLALQKAEVAAYWNAQTHVLRLGERAANFHALCRIRDQQSNMAAGVKAVQTLEALTEAEAATVGHRAQSPGFIVQVVSYGEARIVAPRQMIDVPASPPTRSELEPADE